MSYQENKNSQDDMLDIVNRLWNGERVNCSTCNTGILEPVGGTYSDTRCFVCNKCGEKLDID